MEISLRSIFSSSAPRGLATLLLIALSYLMLSASDGQKENYQVILAYFSTTELLMTGTLPYFIWAFNNNINYKHFIIAASLLVLLISLNNIYFAFLSIALCLNYLSSFFNQNEKFFISTFFIPLAMVLCMYTALFLYEYLLIFTGLIAVCLVYFLTDDTDLNKFDFVQYFRFISNTAISKIYQWGGVLFFINESIEIAATFLFFSRVSSLLHFIPNNINFIKLKNRKNLSIAGYSKEVSLISIIIFLLAILLFILDIFFDFFPNNAPWYMFFLFVCNSILMAINQPLQSSLVFKKSNIAFLNLAIALVLFSLFFTALDLNDLAVFISMFISLNTIILLINFFFFVKRKSTML